VEDIKNAKLPMIIVGRDALSRSDSQAILNSLKQIASNYGVINSQTGWNGFNVLHRSQG
jgi:NADH-quinone oxidoreductase subunit G